jgi:DNA-binding CsgD family transcriptional regulator
MIKTVLKLFTTEHKHFFSFAFFVGVLSILDLGVDLSRGVSLYHIFFEGSVIVVSTAILTNFIRKERSQNKSIIEQVNKLEKESFILREDIKKYKSASQKYVNEIANLIDQQLNDWELSKSEKDVALLLLKGLSHKEIADIRQTSEKTVRHQAGIVYAKARLDGRAQLSAFFLEDILNSSKID